jgi:hypothetical protein
LSEVSLGVSYSSSFLSFSLACKCRAHYLKHRFLCSPVHDKHPMCFSLFLFLLSVVAHPSFPHTTPSICRAGGLLLEEMWITHKRLDQWICMVKSQRGCRCCNATQTELPAQKDLQNSHICIDAPL